uniref:Uncharacterized protein n=1 Tax=Timema shepardi TaxID=629360 RepID=A0A7R9B7V9_TIMSH|nr:unnamed protein product [Timema shepardi]
MSWVTVSRK